MWLNKIKEKIVLHQKYPVNFESLVDNINKIKKISDIIAICPQPTGGNWLGVNRATNRIFPDKVLSLPHYYSNSLLTEKQQQKICELIVELNFEHVIFSGFLEYFALMTDLIKNGNKNCRIAVLFHGSLSELAYTKNPSFGLLIKYSEEKKFDKIGFLKKGMAEVFAKLFNIKGEQLFIKTDIAKPKDIVLGSSVNIGVFGTDNFNKNIHNQVVAGLLVDGSNVHVLKKEPFYYYESDRIIGYNGILSNNDFLSLLSGMHINLYISFSEACPQIVIESLAAGVPCLTSNNNGIFDYDDYLAEKLIVKQYDNPIAIAKQIEKVLDERDEISLRGVEYIKKINSIAEEKLKAFLED